MTTSPEFEDVLSTIETALISELDKAYQGNSLPEVAIAAACLDSFLCTLILEMLGEYATFIWPDARVVGDRNILQIGDSTYEIRISEHILQYDVIEIGLARRGFAIVGSEEVRSEDLLLDGSGRYKKVTWSLPTSVRMERDRAFHLVGEILQIGYRWLRQKLLRTVSRHQKGLGDELYRLLRMLAPNEDLVDGVWFAVGAREGGFYLLDMQAADVALNVIDQSRAPLGEGSARLVAEFISALFPEELTFAGKAVRDKIKLIEADLPKANYAKSLSMVNDAEIAIYGSKVVVVYTIVSTGLPYLVAVFAQEKRDQLVPFFEQHSHTFAEIFLRSRDQLRWFIRSLMIPGRSLEVGKIGEFVGGLIKGLNS
jgi:hypothetical protein